MAIKISINSSEVKNPLARFLISLVGLMVFALMFFLFLPLIWFLLLLIVLSMVVLLVSAPKFLKQYKFVVRSKQIPETYDIPSQTRIIEEEKKKIR